MKRKLLVSLTGAALLASAAAASAAVVEADLNLRSGPGTGYPVVAVMPAGTNVEIIRCTGAWCRVAWGGAEGFANRSYLERSAPPPVVYAAPPPPPVFYGPPRPFYNWHHRWSHRPDRWHHRWRYH